MMSRRRTVCGTSYALCHIPVGWLGLVAGAGGLLEIIFAADSKEVRRRIAEAHPQAMPGEDAALTAAIDQLEEYFRGLRRSFSLPLDFRGLSSFTAGVLHALAGVPSGQTVTYGELAVLVGRPRAARAVGRAMAANPFPIVIPCHRVVGADGRLVGYSGAEGIATKEWLLRFEADNENRTGTRRSSRG